MGKRFTLDEVERIVRTSENVFITLDRATLLELIDEVRAARAKGKAMSDNKLPRSLGMYYFERSTSRFHVYSRVGDNGVKEAQYIKKTHFESDEKPKEIELFVRW